MPKELEVLLGSKTRLKILKLFFQNEEAAFNLKDVSKRSQVPRKSAKKEIEKLNKVKLLKTKVQKRKRLYSINPKFLFFNELRTMIFRVSPLYLTDLKTLFKKDSKIKLVVVSGAFLQEGKASTDLLIVGDKVGKSKITKIIKRLESETGREIKWSLMTKEEFNYRNKMNDRFLRDVFDHAHKKIINKLKI